MERLELSSRTGTNTATNLTTNLQPGPYAPIVITNLLAQAIQGICGSGKEVFDHPEPTERPPEKEKKQVHLASKQASKQASRLGRQKVGTHE